MRKLRLIGWVLCMLLLAGCRTVPEQTRPVPTDGVFTQPPTEAAAATEVTVQPPAIIETARARITVTGDVMMHIPVINSGFDGTSYNYDGIFAHITDYVSGADLAVANLETTLAGTENGDPYSGFPRFNCPDALADALKNAGFDLLLTANNHSNDTGAYGMNRTLEVLADRGLLSLGTTREAEDPDYLVQEINGIRVGMVCYTYGEIDGDKKSVNGLPVSSAMTENINVFDYNRLDRFYAEMEAHIAGMQADGAEAIVLFIHWGNEYKTQQGNYQMTIAQKMCDLGVDVIVGGHPHVVQGVEVLASTEDPAHQTVCVYSLGNALSNQRATNMDLATGHTEDGMLFSFTFVKYSSGEVFLDSAEILPTWVCMNGRSGGRTYKILPLDREIGDWQTAFGIGDSDFGSARASYDRTMALVGAGMENVALYLEEIQAALGPEYIVSGGVG